MIEKMRFLSITGPKADFDRMVDKYISRYPIQLENALTEVKKAQGVAPFAEDNPYRGAIQTAKDILREYKAELPAAESFRGKGREIPLPQAADEMERLSAFLTERDEKRAKLRQERETLEDSYKKIASFSGLDYDIRSILHFQNIKYSFGRMPVGYYQKIMDYVYETLPVIVSECTRDKENVYLVYFTPSRYEDRIDAVFASMYFEKIFIDDVYSGTPTEAIERLHAEIQTRTEELSRMDEKTAQYLRGRENEIMCSADRLLDYEKTFEVRRYAALTKQDAHTFYILCGWMPEADAKAFQHEIEKDDRVFSYSEDNVSKLLNEPPVKLRHPAILRPFEMFLEMYGLPAYDELDPTLLLAVTYMLFFGFMFGDFGQGLVLCLGGALLYRLKGVRLAGIISCCGVSSMIFGLLFGSVFGFEDIIEPLWLNPQEAMTNLPFIGNLNTVFVAAVAIGMGMVLLCMILNMINAFRQHDRGKALLDANGAAGLVFYAALALCVILCMSGHAVPAAAVLAILFGIPLCLIFFRDPLMGLLAQKKRLMEGGVGMFLTQGFFELFEMLLSYFSNTLSFVRIGAFAVSHAAMMGVVLMLAGAENGGDPNWMVVILGNLFVSGMEGLIVGIQVLRLEYYELFSRFYKGGGRPFTPYGSARSV